MGLKIAVVGGGSTYTPELVHGFAADAARLAVDELVLFDLDTERVRVVGGLARRMLERAGLGGRLVVTERREEALDGADFVIVQLRVGGQAQRLVDETLPLEFGCIGQETTGPGGFAKALRTVPVVLELAEETARRSAPGVWLVDFTNPVGIVTQALLDEGYRAIGLCNVAIGLQRRLAAHFGVEPERVELEHVGLNHLSWARAVRVDGVDRLPELLQGDRDAEMIATAARLPVELVRLLGAIPSYYLHYYYLTSEVLEQQRRGPSRAEDVIAIERELLSLYRDPALDTKPAMLERRGGAFYSEAAVQLIASLHEGTGDVQVVDVRNDGSLPDLPADAVVEVPARIDTAGAHPVPLGPLAPELLGLVQRVKAYERLTVQAARTGDRGLALKALLTNPLVGEYQLAVPLLDALLEGSRAHLPRFFPGRAGAATRG
jgi:6-phospho-beta-glucosidase